MLVDFGWLRRYPKGLNVTTLEEGIGQALLTLTLAQQQVLFMEWFEAFSGQGRECPNLMRAFQVWWRRSFIPPAPLRVGKGEPPPSWDPVPTPIGKQRADWNPTLEKSLVEILHEYKDSGYRSDNGWNTEGWNKMVKEFHLRNKSVSYTKAQIQDKECQLKRDYKMIKAARMQSGSKWNEQRNMVEGSASMWENLIVTFPKIKKFQNNKASFPLFDALGELYDGHLAEGTYNFTSIESEHVEEPLQQINVVEEEAEEEALQEIHEIRDEDDEEKDARDKEEEARSGQRRMAASRKKPEKKGQRPRKSAKIEAMMERFLEMRTKQAEDEAQQLARENETREKEARDKEAAKGDEYSIKRCISIINTMEVTKQEKAKSYAIFTKSKENRETFICASEEDEESALIWLRNEMA
ncbi:uncharacterized protein LOC101780370 isoform X3 [Setaria italica]|uniref:uncharacterized protein LOC101780370 isoform X3 n=1 Tax=Setaria italica TaxID=4555 RepID=UPI0003509FE7|nr:uncharacterized protein LOC101780370 isoform X3 [Setaria italica]